VANFLAPMPEETAFVEIKLALSDALRAQRQKAKLSQAQAAKRLGFGQARVAKMGAGDPSVTLAADPIAARARRDQEDRRPHHRGRESGQPGFFTNPS
jgi:hypothetical protein